MTYFPFDQDRDNAGKQTAKRLKSRIGGDVSGFRTVIEKNLATGEEVMLRTKGGMPEVTVKPGKKVELPEDRTFVFRAIGATTGVIANRKGDGMAVIVPSFRLQGRSSSSVGNVGKSARKWRDVWRLDQTPRRGINESLPGGKTTFQINGKDNPATELIYVADYGWSAIPYLATLDGSYAKNPIGDTARSLLFVGVSDASTHAVVSLKTDGTELERVTVPTSWWNDGSTCGLRATPDGCFYIYGGRIFDNDGTVSFYYDTLYSVNMSWAKVRASTVAPFLSVVASGSHTVQNMVAYPLRHSDPTDPLSTTQLTFSTNGSGGAIYHTDRTYQDYGYAGTDTPIAFSYMAHIDAWTNESTFNGDAVTEGRMTIRGVVPAGEVGQDEISPGEKTLLWYKTFNEENRSHGRRLTTTNASSVDYIYADFDEGVFLSLESYMWGRESWVTDSAYSIDGGCTIQWVLEIRGTRHVFPHHVAMPLLDTPINPASPTMPCVPLHFSMHHYGEGWRTFAGFTYVFGGLWPVPMINAPFMSQANCPYIAYTTRAEEAAGATPEFYLDIEISPKRYYLTAADYGGSPRCHQFVSLFMFFLQTYNSIDLIPIRNADLWDVIFPPNNPMRIQFCNGVKGPWADKLGSNYANNPKMEITRI